MARSAEVRRELTRRKINRRKSILKHRGLQGGTVYERHRVKINCSLGYIRDGNLSHYGAVGFGEKTNNRGGDGRNYNPSIRDKRSNLKAKHDIEEITLDNEY